MQTVPLNKMASFDSHQQTQFSLASQQLQKLMNQYFQEHPSVSLNGLAKKCQVSEPTLRRIKKGELKTLPSTRTIIEILKYLTKSENLENIISYVGGPLAEHLNDKTSELERSFGVKPSKDLTEKLRDPVKYLIYKIASNPQGIDLDKVVTLFGGYGEKQLLQLEMEELVLKEGKTYKAQIKHFALSNEVFVANFKSTADFIKPHKHSSAQKSYTPIFSNYSSSVNQKGYKEVVKAQRNANKKILSILTNKNYQGLIPTFAINAIDTLDNQSAEEFVENLNRPQKAQ